MKRDVIGPDENHEHVNNNAFTNRMVSVALGSFPHRLVAQLSSLNERLN